MDFFETLAERQDVSHTKHSLSLALNTSHHVPTQTDTAPDHTDTLRRLTDTMTSRVSVRETIVVASVIKQMGTRVAHTRSRFALSLFSFSLLSLVNVLRALVFFSL